LNRVDVNRVDAINVPSNAYEFERGARGSS